MELTQLVPVKDWPWALYKITFGRETGPHDRLVKWLVTTDTQLDSDCQYRWPSSYYDMYEYEHITDVKEPPRVPSQYGVQHVDCWKHGEDLARKMNIYC